MPPLVLTTEETETLERWARRPTTAQALAQRARIVLTCATGTPNDGVARRLQVKEKSGLTRTITLLNVRASPPVGPRTFVFDVPKGVRVVDQ